MDAERRTRNEIDRRVSRLREEYGEFPVRESAVWNDPEFFEEGRERTLDGWIGDAAALVTDDEGRVLMIRHEGVPDRWGIPGGGHEPGETMEETARRELREETGIECTITDVNFARRKTVRLETDPGERFSLLTVVFDAKYELGTISIGDDEVLEARWFEERPEHLLDFVREYVLEGDR